MKITLNVSGEKFVASVVDLQNREDAGLLLTMTTLTSQLEDYCADNAIEDYDITLILTG